MFKVAKNPLSRIHIVENAEHALSAATDYKGYTEKVTEFINDSFIEVDISTCSD